MLDLNEQDKKELKIFLKKAGKYFIWFGIIFIAFDLIVGIEDKVGLFACIFGVALTTWVIKMIVHGLTHPNEV